MKALCIGRVSVDEYYAECGGGEIVRRYAGSGFITAQWFDHYGFDTALATTLGDDFPRFGNVSYEWSRGTHELTPVCEVGLSEGNEPEATGMRTEYELRELPTVTEEFDVVFLSSVEEEFLGPFESADAPIKGYDPGLMFDSYRPSLVERGFGEATHAFMSDEERDRIVDVLSKDVPAIHDDYGLESVFCTSKEKITSVRDGTVRDVPVETLEWTVDSLGAGDAFASSYLAGLARGVPPSRCESFAKDVARHTTLHVGALPYALSLQPPW